MDYEKAYKSAKMRCEWQLANGLISEECATDLFRDINESEDEKIRKKIIEIFKSIADGKIPIAINYADIFTWLEKQKEQQPADYTEELKKCKGNPLYFFDKYVKIKMKPAEWSEEDKRILNEAIIMIEARGCWVRSKNAVEQVSDFLKSLPERFNLQSKQEWSEEDEKMVRFYEASYNNQIGDMSMKDVIDMKIKFKDWLVNRVKSLRSRPHWKPTAEHLSALSDVLEESKGNRLAVLKDLYNHIKEV